MASTTTPKTKKPTTKKQKVNFSIDRKALQKVKLVAVAYSDVKREWFPTEESYIAELEVEERAEQVIESLQKMGIPAKGYRGDQYLVSMLQVDDPDLVLNLVDTLRGKDSLQTSVPAALELADIPYTGTTMQGMVIGNNRYLIKQLLTAFNIPTPDFQYITKAGTPVDPNLGVPLIVKLNESGGSVGIDNNAVKETPEDAQKQIDDLINTYQVPVIVERFVDGPELTVCVFDDGRKRHVFMAEKIFGFKPDGKHNFTSLESYDDEDAYKYKKVDAAMEAKVSKLAIKAFRGLLFDDYAKFDVRVDEQTGTPYFTDCNPNTAFGPDKLLPFTEVLAMHGVKFDDVLASLVSKHVKQKR